MSTSIDDLPYSPQTDNNIQLRTDELNVKIHNSIENIKNQRNNELTAGIKTLPPQETALTEGPDNINQFISGIQQAANNGLLELPSKDIPQQQSHLTQDPQMKPNFIPQPENVNLDYISQHQTSQDIINEQNKIKNQKDYIDIIFSHIQTPILIGILFFIFQLPIINITLYSLIPILFRKDGNLNLAGYIFQSFLFGLTYFLLTKFISYISI
jgi:hypothetical protein